MTPDQNNELLDKKIQSFFAVLAHGGVEAVFLFLFVFSFLPFVNHSEDLSWWMV